MTFSIVDFHGLVSAFPIPWMADLILRATVILAVAGLIAALLRRAPAAARHALWAAALLSILAMPLFLALPGWHIIPVAAATSPPAPPVTPPTAAHASQMTPAIPASNPLSTPVLIESTESTIIHAPAISPPILQPPTTLPPAPEPSATPIAQPVPAENPTPIPWPTLILATWAVGTVLLLTPTLAALFLLRRVEKHSRPVITPIALQALEEGEAAAGIQRKIPLLESPACRVPMTFGLWRPRIIIPAASATWSADQWHMILAHELAHIRRRDLLTMQLARLARALYWFHPLAWLACNRLALEGEKACDDAVLRTSRKSGAVPSEDAAAYAAALVHIAANSQKSLLRHAVLHMARQSTLESRVRRVLDARARRGISAPAILAIVLTLTTLSTTLGLLRTAPAQSQLTLPPTTAPAELTPAQKTAAQAMLKAALAERQGMIDIADIRAKTPEFLEAWLAPEFRILTARLLLNPAGPERKAALQEYLEVATKINQLIEQHANLDATKAALARGRYAVAEAQCLLAQEGAKQAPQENGAAEKMHVAHQAMLQAAEDELAGLLEIEEIRVKSPEYLEVRLTAQRRIFDCDLLVHPERETRKRALQEYLTAVTQFDKAITARANLDATKASLAHAHYALAEAQYLLAHEDANEKELKSAAAAMLQAAQLEQQGIADIESIVPISPEFLEVKIAASLRLVDAQLLVDPQSPAWQDDLKRMTELRAFMETRRDFDATKAAIALSDYAVAEAQFHVATPATPATASPPGANSKPAEPTVRLEIRAVADDSETAAVDEMIDPNLPTRSLRVKKEVLLDTSALASVKPGTQFQGYQVIDITFTQAGAKRFAEITAANLHKQIAFVIDGKLMCAPTIQSVLGGGQAQISFGKETTAETVKNIADALQRTINQQPAAPRAPTPASVPATLPALPGLTDDDPLVVAMNDLPKNADIDSAEILPASALHTGTSFGMKTSFATDEGHLVGLFEQIEKSRLSPRPDTMVVTWPNPGTDRVQIDLVLHSTDPASAAKTRRTSELLRDLYAARAALTNPPIFSRLTKLQQPNEWEIETSATAQTTALFIRSFASRDHFLTVVVKTNTPPLDTQLGTQLGVLNYTISFVQRPDGPPQPAGAVSTPGTPPAPHTAPQTAPPPPATAPAAARSAASLLQIRMAIPPGDTTTPAEEFTDSAGKKVKLSAKVFADLWCFDDVRLVYPAKSIDPNEIGTYKIRLLWDVGPGKASSALDGFVSALEQIEKAQQGEESPKGFPNRAAFVIQGRYAGPVGTWALPNIEVPLWPMKLIEAGNLVAKLRGGLPGRDLGASSVYYVMGTIDRPGVYALPPDGKINILQAMAACALQNPSDTVTLVRRLDDTHETKTTIQFSDLVADRSKDMTLQSNDVLIVAHTPPKQEAAQPDKQLKTLDIIPADEELAPNVPGEIYIMGEVTRPGVYSLTGRKLTLKQALAAAAVNQQDLPLLWATLTRRAGNQERTTYTNLGALFDGTEADRFLQANDLINITHGGILEIRAVADAAETGPAASLPDPNDPTRTLHVKKEVLLDTAALASATVGKSEQGHPVIDITFTDPGAKRFAEITRDNLHKQLAILINGKLVCAPTIQSTIDGGNAQISFGNQIPPESVKAIADALQSAINSRQPRPTTAPATLPATR